MYRKGRRKLYDFQIQLLWKWLYSGLNKGTGPLSTKEVADTFARFFPGESISLSHIRRIKNGKAWPELTSRLDIYGNVVQKSGNCCVGCRE